MVRRLAGHLLGKVVEGTGATCEEAVADAVSRRASVDVCAPYTSTSSAAARRIAEIYDRITDEGRDLRVPAHQALRAAFARHRSERTACVPAPGPGPRSR